ncbi:UNVERIFIED_CONTAM: hypothetical protein RMT77_004218 [Armadillidium vulgare]
MCWFYLVSIIYLSSFSSSQPSPNPENCTECSPTYCPTPVTCLYGEIENPNCKCCDLCLRGPGESCGGFTFVPFVCADGYYCLYSAIIYQIADLPGTCVEGERIDPANCTECSKYFCTEGCCKFGSLPNPNCDCCEVCLKGQGECCGGSSPLAGICAEGFHCHKFYDSYETAGVCVED